MINPIIIDARYAGLGDRWYEYTLEKSPEHECIMNMFGNVYAQIDNATCSNLEVGGILIDMAQLNMIRGAKRLPQALEYEGLTNTFRLFGIKLIVGPGLHDTVA